MEKRKENKNVPNLRFKGFEGEWEMKKLGDVTNKINSGKTPLGGEAVYKTEGILFIRSQNVNKDNLDLDNVVFISEEVNNTMRNSIVKSDDILLNITGASLGRSCVVPPNFETGNVNQHVCIIRVNENINPRFVQPILSSKKGQDIFNSLQTGGGREGLNFENIRNVTLHLPSVLEQNKIANFLSVIDNRIQTQSKIIEGLKTLKTTLRNKLFEQVSRDENQTYLIKEILDYEQPNKYLVSNTEYSTNTLLIPVLTANKGFILGYTDEDFGIYNKDECIIFDDFTMDLKFVNFPFKVKSSAIKILTAKPNINLKYIYEYLIFLSLQSNEHKRHYISEIEVMKIGLPIIEVQNKTAKTLSNIDTKLTLESRLATLYNQQKKFILNNLFI